MKYKEVREELEQQLRAVAREKQKTLDSLKVVAESRRRKRWYDLLRLQQQQEDALARELRRVQEKEQQITARQNIHNPKLRMATGIGFFLMILVLAVALFHYNSSSFLTGLSVGEIPSVQVQDKHDAEVGSHDVNLNADGKYTLEIHIPDEVSGTSIAEVSDITIMMEEAEILQDIVVTKADYYEGKPPAQGKLHTKVVSVEGVGTVNATIHLPKLGEVNTIFRCDDFDPDDFKCGEWEATDIPFDDTGAEIVFVVDHFSAYAAGEIVAIDAVHLDENYNFLSNIFSEIKAVDGVWSEPIKEGEFARVTFERNLTDGRIIDIYVRGETRDAYVEVYEAGTKNLVGSSTLILSPDWKYITIGGLSRPMDVFDLRITSSDPQAKVEFDYIHDAIISSTLAGGMALWGGLNNASGEFRTWNGVNFTSGTARTQGVGTNGTEDLKWVVLKSTYVRDEMVLGIIDGATDTSLQVYNTTTGLWNPLTEVAISAAGTSQRPFDVAYEDVSGDAIIMYDNTSTNDMYVQYRIWNGTRFSEQDNITMQELTSINNVTAALRWVFLSSRPRADDIMAILPHSSGNSTLFAVLWDGTTWDRSRSMILTNNTGTSTNQMATFAWESHSGDGLAIYGTNGAYTNRKVTVRPYSPTTGWDDERTVVSGTSGLTQLRACADSESDYVGMIWSDGGDNVNVSVWNGTALLGHSILEDGTVVVPGTSGVTLGCEWFNSTSALFFFADTAPVGTLDYFLFTKPNTWNVTDLTATASTYAFAPGSIGTLSTAKHPTTGEIMFAVQETGGNRNFTMIRWSGTQFVSVAESRVAISLEAASGQQGSAFEWDRYDPKPNVTTPVPARESTFTAGNTIEIGANVTDNIYLTVADGAPFYANLTYPNGSRQPLTITNTTGAGWKFNTSFVLPSSVTGVYTVYFTVNDSRNSFNTSEFTNFTVSAGGGGGGGDSTPPNVTQLVPTSGTQFNTSLTIEVGANITEGITISIVTANITYPNGSMISLPLTNATTGVSWPTKFNASFTIPQLSGTYTIAFMANDTSNNMNSTQTTTFTGLLVCGQITGSTNMNQNLSSPAGCFNIARDNLRLNCAGYEINYSRSGFTGSAVNNTNGYDNVTIQNCVIREGTSTTNGKSAILFNTTAVGGRIYNNSITLTGSDSIGIQLGWYSNNTNVSSNTITTYGLDSLGIMVSNWSAHNIISFNILSTVGQSADGIMLATTWNNTLRGNEINASGTGNALLLYDSGVYNNSFINNTFLSFGNYSIYDDSGPTVTNKLIYEGTLGMINWSRANLTTILNLSQGRTIFIANRTVGLFDDINALNLNGTAQIEIRNLLYFIRPILLKAGARCDNTPYCNFTYTASSGLLVANVSSFSNYTTNVPPTHNAPILNTTNPTLNDTNQNLTVYPQNVTDLDQDRIKNITSWRINNTPFMVLNMPFEALNGTLGNNAKDYSGYNNNGSDNNSTTSPPVWNATGGYDGWGAYQFDGVDDNITIPNSNSLRFSTNDSFTKMAWIRTNISGRRMDVLDFRYAGGVPGTLLGIHTTAGGRCLIEGPINSLVDITSAVSLSDNRWHHITCVWDFKSTGNASLYVDGVWRNSTTITSLNGTVSHNNVKVIGRAARVTTVSFNGTIDEVKVFNRSLSAEQILAIFNNRTDLIVSQELTAGQNWTADITPNDGRMDGETLRSNSVITTTVTTNVLPTASVTGRPFNGSTVTNRTPTFEWFNSSDDNGDVISYHLQVDDRRTFDDPEINVSAVRNTVANPTNTSYFSEVLLTSLLPMETIFFWRVRANDSTGYGGWSDSSADDGPSSGLNRSNFTIGLNGGLAGLIAFGGLNNASPQSRVWSVGGNLSFYERAQGIGTNGTDDIPWLVLRSSWKHDQFIIGTKDASTDINIQIFNRSNTESRWEQRNEISINTGSVGRQFDIAYEQQGGDALIVYENTSSNDIFIQYLTWNGTRYSLFSNITLVDANGGNFGRSSNRFVQLTPKSKSDEIMLLIQNSSNQGGGLFAAAWDGTTFNMSTSMILSNLTNSATEQHFAFAWEAQSGEGIAVYGVNGTPYNGAKVVMRTYSGVNLWGNEQIISNVSLGGVVGARLCADPESDYVGIMWQEFNYTDSTNSLNVSMWNGTDLINVNNPLRDPFVESVGTNAINFDCAWYNETSALFAFTDNAATSLDYFTFTKPNSWNTSDLTVTASTNNFGRGNHNVVRFSKHPYRGEIMAAALGELNSVTMIRWLGNGSRHFASVAESPAVWTTEVVNGAQEGFMFAWQEYDPVPNVTALLPSLNSAFEASQTIEIAINVTDDRPMRVNGSFPFFANITRPGGTIDQVVLSNDTTGVGRKFNASYTIPSTTGVYNVTFLVNDTRNNLNWTERTNFTVTAATNTLPTAPVTGRPFNGSGITNRTPIFDWFNSSDADGNVISYHLQVDDNARFNNPEINVSAIQDLSSAAPGNTTWYSTVELAIDTTYFWRVRANDSTGYGTWSNGAANDGPGDASNLSNFTVNSLLSITMMANAVEFGTVTPGMEVATSDGDPAPFRAENTGNIDTNVSINASALFTSVVINRSNYQFQIRANESNSFSLALSTTSWTNMSNSTTRAHVVNLTWRDARNDFLTDINLTIPSDEPSGFKTSTITFTVVRNE